MGLLRRCRLLTWRARRKLRGKGPGPLREALARREPPWRSTIWHMVKARSRRGRRANTLSIWRRIKARELRLLRIARGSRSRGLGLLRGLRGWRDSALRSRA